MATECECVSDPVDGPTREERVAAWAECGRVDALEDAHGGDPDCWTGSAPLLECQCECAAAAYWAAYDAATARVEPVEYVGPVDMILSAEECRRIITALRAYVPADGSAPFDAWLLAERLAQAIDDAAYHASDAADPYDAHGAGFRGSTVEWYNRGADDAALGFDRDPLVETNAPGRAEYAAYDAGYRRYRA